MPGYRFPAALLVVVEWLRTLLAWQVCMESLQLVSSFVVFREPACFGGDFFRVIRVVTLGGGDSPRRGLVKIRAAPVETKLSERLTNTVALLHVLF